LVLKYIVLYVYIYKNSESADCGTIRQPLRNIENKNTLTVFVAFLTSVAIFSLNKL